MICVLDVTQRRKLPCMCLHAIMFQMHHMKLMCWRNCTRQWGTCCWNHTNSLTAKMKQRPVNYRWRTCTANWDGTDSPSNQSDFAIRITAHWCVTNLPRSEPFCCCFCSIFGFAMKTLFPCSEFFWIHLFCHLLFFCYLFRFSVFLSVPFVLVSFCAIIIAKNSYSNTLLQFLSFLKSLKLSIHLVFAACFLVFCTPLMLMLDFFFVFLK